MIVGVHPSDASDLEQRRDQALFDCAIDPKLRVCDLVKARIGELVSVGGVVPPAVPARMLALRADVDRLLA